MIGRRKSLKLVAKSYLHGRPVVLNVQDEKGTLHEMTLPEKDLEFQMGYAIALLTDAQNKIGQRQRAYKTLCS